MEELMSSRGEPDAPTPISSAGSPAQAYGNAAGDFDLRNKYGPRKVKSRKDLDQPKFAEEDDDDSMKRYYGSFSIEAKRNVMDLLESHPQFGPKEKVRMNRIGNNTREVMPNDPTKTVEIGGSIHYQNQPQASQTKYP